MATIHVNRGGTSMGTFSEDDVRAGLRSGRLLGSDLGWREGMATWQPLSQFTEFTPDIAAAATAGPAPTGAGAPPAAAVPPAPAAAPAAAGTAMVAGPVMTVTPRSGLPWDRRQERGFFSAFFETLGMVLTKPAEAFTAMRREGGFAEPLIYGLIGCSFGYIVYLLLMMLMPSFAMFGDRNSNALAGLFGLGFGMVLCIILVPVGVTILLFLASAILHVCLMLVGGAKQSFETTFRVVCFALGSTYPLMIVPACGGLAAGVWGLVCECIGLARAHETDTGRAVFAVFLPLIVCCGGGLLIAMMFGALGAMSGHHAG